MIEQVTLLALGWLSGVLSPIIVDAIRSRRESEAVMAAVKSELTEVSRHMVLAAYSVTMQTGEVDRSYLKWVQDSLLVNLGSDVNDKMVDSLALKLSWSDETIADYAAAQAAKGINAIALVKFAVPFVDARVSAWHAIPESIRLELHAVRSDVRLLDDLGHQSRTYFHLTFGKLDPGNYETVATNLRGVYKQYAVRCRCAAERMNHLRSVL